MFDYYCFHAYILHRDSYSIQAVQNVNHRILVPYHLLIENYFF